MKKRKHIEEHSSLKVILEGDIQSNPKCDHGPSVLFERIMSEGKIRKQFFACSAFRDRKNCPFYMINGEKRPKIPKMSSRHRLKLIHNPKSFCSTCQILLEDSRNHSTSHELITDKGV